MSRIHEALKRAEQERAASQGGRGGSAPMAEAAAAIPPAAEPPGISSLAAAVPASPSSHLTPASGNPLTFDMLLARCALEQWRPDAKTMLFFNEDENRFGVEEFRALRSRLYQVRKKMTLKKVLVTSALRKEGKSFVAANLAQVLMQEYGRRALLIDADLRGPHLHTLLGTASTPGLSEYLLGEKDEFSIMQRSEMENLIFIPSGRSVVNPAGTVANGRLKTLLQRVEPLFDWVIIDSPPAVPVSDANLLSDYCDGVLMVVRSNATPFDAARKARQEFADKLLVGVVLNGVADSSHSRITVLNQG
jgi:protein-tyrosine kinase